MTERRRDLDSRKWRALRRQVIAESDGTCGICGGGIDLTLSGRHRLGPQVDHIIPPAHGGAEHDLENLRCVHLLCNQRKGQKTTGTQPEPSWRDAWDAAHLFPFASRQWHRPERYQGLPTPEPEPPAWWPPKPW